jgi:CheY-like chemotaxis protein
MVTAFDCKEVMLDEINPGLSGILIKPVKESFLVDTIADIFSKEVAVQFNRPEASSRQGTTDGSASLAGRRVLLVEDNELNRDLAEELLTDLGISVTMAFNGREAVDRVFTESFDLVLMDIQMPIVDGYEATSTIRVWEVANSRRRTPIVALTASALDEAVHRTMAAGCDAHVTKPVKKSTLLNAIRDAVEGHQSDDERADITNLKEETCRTE